MAKKTKKKYDETKTREKRWKMTLFSKGKGRRKNLAKRNANNAINR